MGLKTTYCGLLFILVFAQWSLYAQEASSTSGSTRAARLDSSLSNIYVAQSETALAKGDTKTATDLLRIALEFDSSNSDAYFLQGETYEKSGGKIPEAIGSYRSALSSGTWGTFTDAECRLKLAPLLIRTKQYSEAVDTLQGLGIADARYYLEYARALAGMGDRFRARNLLSAASAAYPSDAQIMLLRARLEPGFRAALAQRYLSPTVGASPDKRILAALIAYTTDPTTQAGLISLYDKSFGFSPVVYAHSLMIASSVTTGEVDKYISSGLLSNGALTEQLYAALPSGAAKSYLAAKIDSYTGTVTLDTNGDGIPEETAQYRGGKLVRLIVDANQDGVPEYDISFSSGVPHRVKLMLDGASYTMEYGSYPFVAFADTVSDGSETIYTLDSGGISLSLFGMKATVPSAPESFPPVVSTHNTISQHDLFAFAVKIEKKNTASQTPVLLWKRSISDILTMEKGWQSGRYNYKAVFHGGEKFSAEIDVDNDGYYEVHERYRNGKLYEVTYDGDHDGIPGFTLVLEPYPILSWDFNDDGIADEIEKKINPTTTILEFSTKMNGVFDVVTKEVKK